MFKKTVETVVGGAIGLFALYAVARLAYAAGKEVAAAEHHYQSLTGDPEEKVPKAKNAWLGKTARKWLGLDDPEVLISVRNGNGGRDRKGEK